MTGLGLYLHRASPLHRAPAMVKLAALVVGVAVVFTFERPWLVATAGALLAAAYVMARIPARVAVRQVRPALPLVVVLAAVRWWTAGWSEAVTLAASVCFAVSAAALVSLTTRAGDLLDVTVAGCRPLRRLGVDPDRVGLVLSLAVRTVPVVTGLTAEVREAHRARGQRATPVTLAVPLVVRTLRHADSLGEALAARGVDD